MSLTRRAVIVVVSWLAGVTLLHLWLNTHVFDRTIRPNSNAGEQFKVGFLPVT